MDSKNSNQDPPAENVQLSDRKDSGNYIYSLLIIYRLARNKSSWY